MAYNKAKEEKKWRLWKEAEEKQLRRTSGTGKMAFLLSPLAHLI